MADITNGLTGITFLNSISQAENACSKMTVERLPFLGEKATQCYEALGMILALLDCAAACWWGCSEGDHRLEYLIGRAANSAYAALAMAERGYYDQALAGARSLGEIANLLALFVANPAQQERWSTLSEEKRRPQFSAVQVRMALEKFSSPIPVNEQRYRVLSSYSIHADPNSVPQSHNPIAQPVSIPIYQEAGFLLALNEISLPIAFIGVFAPKLFKYPPDRVTIFANIAMVLIGGFGGVNVAVTGRPWFKPH